MRQQLGRAALSVLCTGLASALAFSQPPNPGSTLPSPRLYTVTPSGGQAGSVFELRFTGTDIEDPEAILFSVPGIKAEPIVPPPPPPPMPNQPPPPKPSVTSFKVTIPRQTPLGVHDIRIVNKWGISNPRAFVIGDLPETLEKEPNNDVDQAQRIALDSSVHGNLVNPTDVDYYVFSAKAGQRVVVSCLASSIDSRFQPGLELYDPSGRQIAFDRMYSGADALLDHTIAADGDYLVRVSEFTHTRGGPEHFYRLTISTAPWIDAIYPPVLEPGKSQNVVLYGRNLPGGVLDSDARIDGRPVEKLVVRIDAPTEPAIQQRLDFPGYQTPETALLDGFSYHIRNHVGASNHMLLTFARGAIVMDNEQNDTPEQAQPIAAPCDVAGRIEKKNDRDWYQFDAKKGEVWTIELFGQRLGSMTDAYVILRNPANKQDLADLDDSNESLHPFKFLTRTVDPPRHRFVAPADGKYQVMVSSREANASFGPRDIYCLRIAREQPDFRLFVLPADDYRPDSSQLRKNGEEFFHVLAWRLDGFAGPITISADHLPPGVSCQPAIVPPSLKQISLVLSADASAAPGVHEVKIKGTANVNGQPVVREARAAHILWPGQQGQPLPLASRLARAHLISIRDQAPYRVAASLDKLTVQQGDKANIKLTLTRHWPEFKAQIQALPIDVPPNLITVNNSQPMTIAADKNEASAALEVKPNLPPGIYTIVLRTFAQMPYSKDAAAKQKPNVNIVQPSTPITLTVLPKQVATLTLANPTVAAKIGAATEIVVKLARMHDYAGDFKVRMVLPEQAKGLAVEEAAVPAGAGEVKLVLKADADAAPASLANVVIRAVAQLPNNHQAIQEVKCNINVVK
jgi:hypothetical protein